ncbi:MAG: hypothetical protein K0M45_07240 [Candidatus Paracaedibacteraceae bacterium]|nr:hypothetical protein [Candidatus Paracaedibacteraceae bacterium]
MFKILLSVCILYSFSIAEETISIPTKTVDSCIGELKTGDSQDNGLIAGLTERVTPLEGFSTSKIQEEAGSRKQVIHLLVPNLPTAVIIDVPNHKLVTNKKRDIKSQLNITLTTQHPSSMCNHAEKSTSSQKDQYLQSYLRASEIFPMPD